MKKISLLLLILILIFVAIPAGVTYADPGFDRVISEGETVVEDIVVFGGSLLIEPGAIVDGSVSVFGGDAQLAGSIEGDVAIFGGTATISGFVDGDMAVMGGDLTVDSSAVVDGDCVLLGGTVSGDGKDSVGCTGFGDLPDLAFPAFAGTQIDEFRFNREVNHGPGFFGTIFSTIGQSIFLGLLALAVAAAAPNHLNQVKSTMRRKPGAGIAVGFLTLIASISLITIIAVISAVLILVCIGLLGIPLVIVMSLALLAAMILGWIAAGTMLGQKMVGLLNLSNNSLVVAAGLGTVTLTMAAGFLSAMPWWLGGWVWWLIAAAIGLAGLGAATLTRFGTRSYPPAAPGDFENDIKVDAVMATMTDDSIDIDIEDDIDLDPPQKPPVE